MLGHATTGQPCCCGGLEPEPIDSTAEPRPGCKNDINLVWEVRNRGFAGALPRSGSEMSVLAGAFAKLASVSGKHVGRTMLNAHDGQLTAGLQLSDMLYMHCYSCSRVLRSKFG